MIRRILRALEITAVLFLIVLAILAIPTFFDPAFVLTNNTGKPVNVVAQWREKSREVGIIEPMSSHEFSIDDEAAMVFKVRYADGSEAQSEPIYFSMGLKVIATISTDSVQVAYDHDS